MPVIYSCISEPGDCNNPIKYLLRSLWNFCHYGRHVIVDWSFVWKTSVMPYVKPSANKKLQIWMTEGGGDPGLSYGGINHLLTMYMLNLNFKILGEILVCHTAQGGQSSLTMCRLNLNFKILVEILVCYTWWEGQSSLAMSRLNLNFQILGEILVCHTGGSIIFDHVQAKSEL